MLADRISDLAPECYPDGRREGMEWRAGSKGSVSIILQGARQGVFSDFEANRNGDALELVAYAICNDDKSAALKWARGWLGISSMGEAELRAQQAAHLRRSAERQRQAEREKADKIRKAAGLWINSKHSIAGTLADEYLRARSIDISALAHYPRAFRFRDNCYCAERDGDYPAMVVGMFKAGVSGCVAAHRTYLAPDAKRGAWKANINSPRKVIGSWPGALIPVQSGAGARRMRDMKPGEIVALGEGIEEALSIALVKPEWRVFSVGYVANFGMVELPQPARVMLCANNDPEDSSAAKTVAKAVATLTAAGHEVVEAHPPAPFKDWNDLLCGLGETNG